MKKKFIQVPKDLLSRKDLTPTAKLTYGAILDRFGKNGGSWPGLRKIAADIGVSKPAAQRAVKALEKAGLLEVKHGRGPAGTNFYRLPGGHETLPPESTGRARNVTTLGHKSLPQVDTKRVHNQTNEPDQTRPNMGGHMPDDPTGHVVNGVRYGLFDDQGAQPVGRNRKASRPKRTREPDPIWDTVVNVFNLPVVTNSQRGRVGKIVNELRAMAATAPEIQTRADRYRRMWPSVAFTPEALLKHWGMFSSEQPGGPQLSSTPSRVQAPADKYTGVGIRC